MYSLLDSHLAQAAAQGNLIRFYHAMPKYHMEHIPEEHLQRMMKGQMKRAFGDYVVRNKTLMQTHNRGRGWEPEHIVEAECYCFSKHELEAFLRSILNYPEIKEVSCGDHLGLSGIEGLRGDAPFREENSSPSSRV